MAKCIIFRSGHCGLISSHTDIVKHTPCCGPDGMSLGGQQRKRDGRVHRRAVLVGDVVRIPRAVLKGKINT